MKKNRIQNIGLVSDHRHREQQEMSQQLIMSQTESTMEEFELRNRRYIGNKSKLLPFIEGKIHENCGSISSFCDIFAGTGSVSQAFNNRHVQIISNDHLKSNYFSLCTFLLYDDSCDRKIRRKITELNELKPKGHNYFSLRYGGTFYTLENAKKIGAIRSAIDRISHNPAEKQILITSLIYAMDKLANTVGHYDAYRKTLDCTRPIMLKMPKLEKKSTNRNNTVMNKDANEAVKSMRSDVLYLDPPYNSRQYCDAYHLLENVALWQKSETFGKAEKMDRQDMKSQYCLKNATIAFENLISDSKSEHIFLSYNNTGESRDDRSNARISDSAIKKILKEKGKLKIFTKTYSEFTTSKNSSNPKHTERLFYCRVR